MKKILSTTAMLFVLGFTSIFAQSEKNKNQTLQATFKEHFADAKDITWKQTKNFAEATFTINNKQLTIFYNSDNHPFAASRNITSDQLPLALLGDIKRNYKSYWITDLSEVSIDVHSEYYITIQNADGQKIMKSGDGGKWIAYNPAETVSI